MRKIFRLKVILITLGCVAGVTILLPAAYFLFVLGVGMGLGDNPGWMPPSTYSASAPPQWTPDDSEIVFAHGGSIFAAKSDGSSLRLVHGEDGEDDLHYSPALSLDGNILAYQKLTNDGFWALFMDNSKWEIAVSRLDGSDERVLNKRVDLYNERLGSPSWSPDGQELVFISDGVIRMMESDGSEPRPITNSYPVEFPAHGSVRAQRREMPLSWSRDGRRIGFVGYHYDGGAGRQYGSYTLGADAVGLRKVRDAGNIPVWSPDGSRLAFAVIYWDDGAPDTAHLFTSNPDGSDPREVAELPKEVMWDRNVEWSPDGSALLFGPFVVNVDGSVLRILPRPEIGYKPSTGRVIGPSPNDYSLTSWSKDGSRIAILTEYHSVLYTVARDGTDSRVLVEKDEDGNLVAAGGRPLSEGQTVQTIIPPDS